MPSPLDFTGITLANSCLIRVAFNPLSGLYFQPGLFILEQFGQLTWNSSKWRLQMTALRYTRYALAGYEFLTPTVMLCGLPVTNGLVQYAADVCRIIGQRGSDTELPFGRVAPGIGLSLSAQKSRRVLKVSGFYLKHGMHSEKQCREALENGITLHLSNCIQIGIKSHIYISFHYRSRRDALRIWRIMRALDLSIVTTKSRED